MRFSAQALLFDNDGTLISSLASVERCWRRWCEEYGVGAREFARAGLHGRPAADIIADLLPAGQVPAALARIEHLEIADVAGGVEPLPGAVRLTGVLPPERWAVVTSATRALGEARLRAAGIAPPLVVAADDVVRGKPDPEPFRAAAAKLGVDPAHCVVFEDAPVGLTAARAAGMRTVALTTTHARAELSADAVVPDLSAVSVQVTADGLELQAEV
ncbi:HAD-IA family hydrolase [Streptomyces sp. TRM 70351]|uniref:HAD-IA family hydrolase n=1 Tax=Streptomyces sp. TRM 70351 TaxID=3116552 RepID=UPI002E7B38B9|nr:HAD-IA family hydrolase [Streptomyces sp. TRM 70351]MEE1929111.1 HAD-IA family hydrolase [Streptomyces sp. TRM 70351]